jgi:alkylhydroperoxidase family enzyme
VTTDGPRVEPLAAEAAHEAAAQDVPDYVADINVFQVLLRHPPLAKALYALLDPLLLHGTVDTRLRELVIMRVGWVTGSYYEWGQHWSLGQAFGVAADDLAAVRDWEHDDRFDAIDRAILAATDETLAGGPVSDATWAALGDALPDDAQRMELLMLIGGYQMLSGVLRSLRVPLDDGLEVWPPDGSGPPLSPPDR